MNRLVVPVALAAGCALAVVGAFMLGHHSAGGRIALRAVSRPTASPGGSGAAPAKIVSGLRHAVPRIPCAELPDGTLLPFPHGALGHATETTCRVRPVGRDYRNVWRATAPNGTTADFRVTRP